MDQDKIVKELAQLYRLHFHERNQNKFLAAIRKLGAASGLQTDFFLLPQTLPWLLDFARTYGLSHCLQLCLLQLLITIELDTEEQLRKGIKLLVVQCHGKDLTCL